MISGAIEPLTQIFLGLTLAATAGLRAWLPLLVLGGLGYVDAIALNTQLQWLEQPQTLAILAIATAIEIAADKIPAVDNALDAIQLVIRPLAGALAMSAAISFADPAVAAVLGIAAGGTAAGVVETGKIATRLAVNATTLGIGAPVMSVAEDGVAIGMLTLGVLVPLVIGTAVVIGLAIALISLPKLLGLLRRKRRKLQAAKPSSN